MRRAAPTGWEREVTVDGASQLRLVEKIEAGQCVVNSAQEALGVLGMADFSVSLLITDLHLPAMDGFELIERVRADGRTTNLPIVVASGDPDPSTVERVYRLGANAYFCKPYSVAQLCQTVEALLGRGTEHCRDRSAWPAGREIRLSNDG